MKCYGNEVTDFYDKEIPKVDSNHTSLAVISLEKRLKLLSASVLQSANILRKK